MLRSVKASAGEGEPADSQEVFSKKEAVVMEERDSSLPDTASPEG